MAVFVWKAFSANNSTCYRLVARFEQATRAAEVQAELQGVLVEPRPNDLSFPAPAAFVWTESRNYGRDDDPGLLAHDEVLALFHSYYIDWPSEVATWFEARGAKVEPVMTRYPVVSVLFRLPSPGQTLGLPEVFADSNERAGERAAEGAPAWMARDIKPLFLPWLEDVPVYGSSSFFCDGETVAFHVPTTPASLPRLKQWLAEQGVATPTIRLCNYGDAKKFAAVARAKCTACGGALFYVEPKRYGLDVEQLACRACGAMYELEVIEASSSQDP